MATKLRKGKKPLGVSPADFIQKEVEALEQIAEECPNCTDDDYCPTHQQIVTGYSNPDREWN